tara:strand:- start:755 stop:1375 length:621 start_codon:yes stop_codon:yes gene_type:complete
MKISVSDNNNKISKLTIMDDTTKKKSIIISAMLCNHRLNINNKTKDKYPCLKKGTLIHTPIGCVPIESLKIGDTILNKDKKEIKIKNILYNFLYTDKFKILKKNKLGINKPNNNLVISQLHIVEHNGKMYLPKNSNKFKNLPKQKILFYNIETDDYINDWFYANNCLVETYCSGKNPEHLKERLRRLSKCNKNNYTTNKQIDLKFQ